MNSKTMALSRLTRITAHTIPKTFRNATRIHHNTTDLMRLNTSIRRKTYLVGVDGSHHGYEALKSVAKTAEQTDKIISMYFPTNIAVNNINMFNLTILIFNLCCYY